MEFCGDITTYLKTLIREQVENYHNDKEYQEAYDFIDKFYSKDGMQYSYIREWLSETLIECGLITKGALHDAIIQSVDLESTDFYEFMINMDYDCKMELQEEDEE